MQGKYMKSNWSYDCGRGGRVKFMSAKRRSADGKELNTLVASAMAKATKMNNKSKANENSKSDDDNEPENFNLEHPKIGMDGDYE